MSTYTNPTGTFDATAGDDTFTFTAVPSAGTTTAIDALGGHDSLLVQVAFAGAMNFDATDNGGASFTATTRFGPDDGLITVYDVESVEFDGTTNDDTFNVKLGGTTAGEFVKIDGGAGNDSLHLDVSSLTTDFSLVDGGSAIASSWGGFSNLESFEIRTGSGNDTITTGGGNDSISTGTGADNVSAGAGNDYIYSQASSGTIDGGDGYDTFSGGPVTPAAETINVSGTITFSTGLTIKNIESFGLAGGSGDDLFVDTLSANGGSLYGGDGRDTLVYGAPSNAGIQVSVQAHSDQVEGSVGPSGNQLNFYQFETLNITGTQYDDHFQINAYYPVSSPGISFDGDAGMDSLAADFSHFSGASTFVVSSDSTVTSNRGHFANIESFSLTGGSAADTLATGSGNDWLYGGGGADHLDGGAGDDWIYGSLYIADDDGALDVLIGGAGNDNLAAGYGDSVDGGSGTDVLYYTASSAIAGIVADFSQLTSGGMIDIGGGTLSGVEQVAQVTATDFNDSVVAGARGPQGETIYALGGNDRVTGSSGADTIYAGDGDDIVTGGLGADTLSGGAGNDTFMDTAAGLDGDSLDLTLGDTITITDAKLSDFTYSYDGAYLRYSGGSVYIGSQPGHVVATAVAGGGVQLEVQLAPFGTIDQIASELTTGFWDSNTHHWPVASGGTLTVDIETLTPTEQTLARAALQEWSDVIGVHFQEVPAGAQIVFDDSEGSSGPIAATDAQWAGGLMNSARVQISTSWLSYYGTSLNSYSFQTYLHEIGHALGLGHPGNYNETGTYNRDAVFENDSWATSVMSYFDQGESYYFENRQFTILNAVTPMQADIVAAQSLYGIPTTTRPGDTIYGFNSTAGAIFDPTLNQDVAYTIFDSGGIDTLDFSRGGAAQLINLNAETFSNVNGYTGNLAIARGTAIENAIGGGGADTIIGNSADNILTGNHGPDTLTGGLGSDAFRDSEAGHSNDTITDFGAGDKIVFTDASLSNFSFSLLDHTLTYTGGSLTLTNVPAGGIVVKAAAGGGVQLQVPHAPNDFNGDGFSDVLWRNDTGLLTEWNAQSNGAFAGNANANIQMDASWHVAGTGDFNGDGYSDILWRNDNGVVGEWNGQSNGGFAGDANANNQMDNSWHVAGTGDFNGDGIDDILWRNDNGVVGEWNGQANGSFTGDANANIPLDNSWHVVGTGDFNGDGVDDILWRNDNGVVGEWDGKSNGGFVGDANANILLTNDWHVVATGDFNGDGINDILWRNDNGVVGEWNGQSNGGFAGNANANIPVDTNWHVAQVGDFNGDGMSDILWRNTNGTVVEWNGQQNGGFAGNANVNLAVDTHWHIQDPFVHDTLI